MGNIKEPKYDNDLINLGYLKKTINNSEKEMESKNDSIYSKSYTSPPIPPYYAGATYYSDNKIYRCVKDRLVGSFSISDWIIIYDEKKENIMSKNFLFLSEVELKEQQDGKIETFNQDNDPSVGWETSLEKSEHEGDYWRKNENGFYNIYTYVKYATNPITFSWELVDVPIFIFNTITGHKTIYTMKPSSYVKYDLWKLTKDDIELFPEYEIGDYVEAINSADVFNVSDWIKKDDEISLKSIETYYYTTSEIDKFVEIIDENMKSEIQKSDNSIRAYVSESYTTKETTIDLTKKVDANGKEIEKIYGENTTMIPTLNLAQLSIQADGINSSVIKKVGIDEVISRINQSAEAIKIEAHRVDIDAIATFTNSKLAESGSTIINGSNITTGKIKTNVIEGYDQLVLNVSSIEEKTEKLEHDLEDTNSLLTETTANFNDFKDNEYINSISNLQNQIDGAIQFWNGADIPTVNNYPASDWKTENDKNNHRADIYTVIKDVDGEMKQGKSYRFDKVNDVWQWIELTDNELSAVQAIANEANNRSKTNANSITKLQEQDAEFIIGLDNITGRVSKTETTVEDITTTTQTSIGGNNLYLEDALESNALEYHVDGKSEQETRSGKNKLNIDGTRTSQGLTAITNNTIINVSGTSTNTYSSLCFDVSQNLAIGTYTYSIQEKLNTRTGFIATFIDDTSKTYYILPNQLSTTFTTDKEIKSYRLYLETINGTQYNLLIKPQLESGSTATEWEPYGVSPSPDYPSEIKSIPCIRNLLDLSSFNGTQNGITYSYDNGLKISGTCTSDRITLAIPNIELNGDYTFSHNSVGLSIALKNNSYGNVLITDSFISGNVNDTITQIVIYLTNGKTYDTTLKLMLEEGSIAHPYVPYGAWAKVKITGKNLFNKEQSNYFYYQYTFDIRGNIIVGSQRSSIFKYPIPNDKTISLSIEKGYIGNIFLYAKDGTFIEVIQSNWGKTKTFVSTNAYFVSFAMKSDTDTAILYDDFKQNYNLQIEEGSVTEYEPYKEKEVLIDLNKPNLFDGEYEIGGYSIADGTEDSYTDRIRAVNYVPVLPNTKYTYSIPISKSSYIIYYDENKDFINYETLFSYTTGLKEKTFKTPNNTKYIRWYVIYTDTNFQTQLYEGYEPYYELASIGDTKDTLDIVNGQVVIDKKIDEVVLDGQNNKLTYYGLYGNDNAPLFYIEKNDMKKYNDYSINPLIANKYKPYTINSDEATAMPNYNLRGGVSSVRIYIRDDRFNNTNDINTELSNNPVTVKYVLAEPKQIILPNVQIPLFEGINHITLVDDLETTTSIKYYRNTPIAQDYVVQQQLKTTENNLQSEIKQTANSITSDVSAKYSTKIETSNAKTEAINSANASTDSKLENYSTTTEMNNAITQKVSESEASINLEVAKKVNNTDYTGANILLKINDDKSEAKIKADKVKLEGYTTINNGFSVDTNGYMNCNNAAITNANITNATMNNVTIQGANSRLNIQTTQNLEDAILIKGFHGSLPTEVKIGNYLSYYNVYDNNGTILTQTTVSGGKVVTPKVEAGNIDSGRCTLTSSGDRTIYFNKTFPNVPNVVLTPRTTTNGVIAAKISEITQTYFKANIGGTNFGDNEFCWIAISN